MLLTPEPRKTRLEWMLRGFLNGGNGRRRIDGWMQRTIAVLYRRLADVDSFDTFDTSQEPLLEDERIKEIHSVGERIS